MLLAVAAPCGTALGISCVGSDTQVPQGSGLGFFEQQERFMLSAQAAGRRDSVMPRARNWLVSSPPCVVAVGGTPGTAVSHTPFFFSLTIVVSVVCPTGPHPPPLRLARRPNRGHTLNEPTGFESLCPPSPSLPPCCLDFHVFFLSSTDLSRIRRGMSSREMQSAGR